MNRFYQVVVLIVALACALGSLVAYGSNKNTIYCYVSSGAIGAQPTRINFSNNEKTEPLRIPNVVKRWIKELKNDNRFMSVTVSQVRYMQHITFKEGFVTVIAMTWLGTPESADCSWGNTSDIRKETIARAKAIAQAEAQREIEIAKQAVEAREKEREEARLKEESKAKEDSEREAREAREFEAARVEAAKHGVDSPELVRELLKAGVIKLNKEEGNPKEGSSREEDKDSDLKR